MGSGNDILDMYIYETNTLLEQLESIVLDAENLVDIVLRKRVSLLRVQYDTLQLFEQGIGLIDIHIQDIIAAAHNKTPPFLAFSIYID